MPRLTPTELDRLKRVPLAAIMERQGIALTSQGKDLACRCPWHEGDETPSCLVTPASNLWHCFGCNAGGTVIDWVMRAHKVSFRHACELLAKDHPAVVGAAPRGGRFTPFSRLLTDYPVKPKLASGPWARRPPPRVRALWQLSS